MLILALAVAVPVAAVHALTPSPSTHAQDTRWQPFTPDLVAKYRAEGKPVFVDFTASWCLSCQVNERVVLDRSDVQQRLNSSGVELVRADWTRHDETIANTLAALGRSGVPTYALYPADPNAPPRLLPEVLTPGIVLHALDELRTESAAAQSSH
jgi:thiol:disulfide interchange protein DsbD